MMVPYCIWACWSLENVTMEFTPNSVCFYERCLCVDLSVSPCKVYGKGPYVQEYFSVERKSGDFFTLHHKYEYLVVYHKLQILLYGRGSSSREYWIGLILKHFNY